MSQETHLSHLLDEDINLKGLLESLSPKITWSWQMT